MKRIVKSITFAEGIDRIIQEFKWPTHPGKAALAEAERLPASLPEAEIQRRVDLTGEVTVTIDGETARDFDDAVSLMSKGDHSILKVSIADVSTYVVPGSALDREAFQRAVSLYFPDRCLPMLPERLSNDLCSLVPGKIRPTFTAEIEFDSDGGPVRSRFYRSLIRSAARLTYTLVRKIVSDRDPAERKRHENLIPHLERMVELAGKLRHQRELRGSLDFDLPEPEIILDLETGSVEGMMRAERNLAHRLIEEFMIAANEAVARFVTEQNAPMIYRIHETPSPEGVHDFQTFLHNLGIPVKLGRGKGSLEFAKVIEAVKGRDEERVVNTLLLRTMKQAIYDTKNAGHFGLASACYTHFTSPIRRYPDLQVHRILAGLIEQKEKRRETRSKKLVQEIADRCSERERMAMKAEWASRDLAGAFFMQDKAGKTFHGIVGGLAKFGLFVELTPYLVQGLLPFRNMTDDHYLFSPTQHLVIGRKTKKRFRLGERIDVCVKQVNLEKRWIDLCLANSVPT